MTTAGVWFAIAAKGRLGRNHDVDGEVEGTRMQAERGRIDGGGEEKSSWSRASWQDGRSYVDVPGEAPGGGLAGGGEWGH